MNSPAQILDDSAIATFQSLMLRDDKGSYEHYLAMVSFANKCSNQYYVNDVSIIPDADYDILYREIQEFEKSNSHIIEPTSPTQRVGDKLSDKFKSVKHKKPMLSLDNAFDNEELKKTMEGKASVGGKYVAELKLDGLALSIFYKNNKFAYALTRGDKEYGEDVSHTVKTITDIPMELDCDIIIPELEVRGEGFMLKKQLEDYNAKAEANGKKGLANARNGAAGAIRQLDPKLSKERNLSFIPYGLGYIESGDLEISNSHFERLSMLHKFGFRKSPYTKQLSSIEDMYNFYDEIEKIRSDIPFDIDGIVFKVDDIERQEELGYTNRIPRFAIARKFPAMTANTNLKSSDVQVGRTGILTPMGRVEPVHCGGVTVSNITLHNFEKVEKFGLRIGDTVTISRRGDVIPHLEGVLESNGGELIKPPTHCPVCNAPTMTKPDIIGVFCSARLTCPAQAIEAISHFTGKKQMNIDGIGDKIVEALYEKGAIKNVLDLYKLDIDDIQYLPGKGIASARKAIASIQASKHCRLDKFINSIGIPGVGESTSNDLMKYFGSLDAIMNASHDELIKVNDVGDGTANNIIEFFASQENIDLINGLLEVGITFEEIEAASSELAGQTWVVTGTLDNFDKNSIKELLQQKGAKVSGSVSKKTSAVLYGDKAGSKLSKAQELQNSGVDIKILNEADFMAQYMS